MTETNTTQTSLATTLGTLYGIGVGPGDPDLLTLRAVQTLAMVDIIFAASSTKNDYSTALSIAQPHISAGSEIVLLDFPMSRDMITLHAVWKQNAALVSKALLQGKHAAFLTLGDPLIYSTFSYLVRSLRMLHPNLPVVAVPGITSFQAAASALVMPLCEGEENLTIVSGIASEKALAESLRYTDNAVILKAYRNIDSIKKALQAVRKDASVFFASRLGQEGQILCSLEAAPEKPHYFSLLLVKAVK